MLPKESEVYVPLLLEIEKRGGSTAPSDKFNSKNVYEALADYFKLTHKDLDEETKDKAIKWNNVVLWARKKLVDLCHISNAEHGVWTLTERGAEAAKIIRENCPSISSTAANTTNHKYIKNKKEIYNRLLDSGEVTKGQAISIVCGNDAYLYLLVLAP